MGYNLLLSFDVHSVPVGVPSNWLGVCVHVHVCVRVSTCDCVFNMSPSLLEYMLVFHHKLLQDSSCMFLALDLGPVISPLKGVPIPFSGEWYLQANGCALGILIWVWLLPGPLSVQS